jgi:hypothetical protein
MARRSVPDIPAKNGNPFRALGSLRAHLRPSPGAATDRRNDEDESAASAPAASAPLASATGGQSLFRRAIGEVAPIRPDNRAEIEVARPLPVPRAGAHKGAPRPQNDDPLDADYAVVTQLPDDGRVETGFRPRLRTVESPALRRFAELPPRPADDDPTALFRHAVGGVQPLRKHWSLLQNSAKLGSEPG